MYEHKISNRKSVLFFNIVHNLIKNSRKHAFITNLIILCVVLFILFFNHVIMEATINTIASIIPIGNKDIQQTSFIKKFQCFTI